MSIPHSLASSSSPFKSAATKCLVAGLVALLVVAVVMSQNLLPNFDRTNAAPIAIWLMALGVLAAGIVRTVVEMRRFRREWRALDLLKSAPSEARERFPETVAALRWAAVEEAIAERRVDREFRLSNRALATAKLAGIGSLTRFGSSALLVLAVMGTFAGMRNALPALISAIKNTASTGQSGNVAQGVENISLALTVVTEAFGANFLALFGSLVLGLAAFGASLERRDLLTRLELVSERWLYRQLPSDADASELQKAVNELQRSVAAVSDVGYAIGNLSTGISDLKVVLRDSLSDMHGSFRAAILESGVRMQGQLNSSIGELVVTLGATTDAFKSTSVAYEGLVKGLEERDIGVRQVADAFREHSRRLEAVETRVLSASVDATQAAARATVILTQTDALARESIGRLSENTAQLEAAITSHDARIVRIGEQLKELAGQQQQSVTTLASAMQYASAEIAERSREIGATVGAAEKAIQARIVTERELIGRSITMHSSALSTALEATAGQVNEVLTTEIGKTTLLIGQSADRLNATLITLTDTVHAANTIHASVLPPDPTVNGA